jgi:hypothetical protein
LLRFSGDKLTRARTGQRLKRAKRPAVADDWIQDLRYYEMGILQLTRKRNGEYITDAVILYECGDCGSIVESRKTHDEWHEQMPDKEVGRG